MQEAGRRKQNFGSEGKGLSEAIDDSAFIEVVWGHFEFYAVAIGEADEAFAHLAGDVRENLVLVREFDPKHGPGENGNDLAFGFNKFVWLHNFFQACLRRRKARRLLELRETNCAKAGCVPSSPRQRGKTRARLPKAEVSPNRFKGLRLG
jgi:hypothetical protein